MILYLEDIHKFRPYIHFETKNTSAIRICNILKSMGISNWYFPLALHQSELKNVDPFDPNLSIEMKQKILIESRLNIWYYIREVLRIPSSGGDAVYFEFNRGNLAFLWSFFNDVDLGYVCMRQIGKTTTTCAIMSWLMAVGAENITIGFCSKDGTNTSDAVRRLKDMLHELPPYFVQKTTNDIDRKESLSLASRHNFYITFTPANDEAGAFKIGRGFSIAYWHFDEIAYFKYNHLSIPSAVNAMNRASEQVRAQGLPSPVIYTTTAGNPDTKPGQYALKVLQSGTPFSESMYDLQNRDALLQLIDQTSENRMLYLEFSYKQLGKSDEWLNQIIARSQASPDDVARDLLNIWQSSNDKAVIPQHLLELIRASKRDPDYVDLKDGFVVKWYLPRNIVENHPFIESPLIMGMDTSENVGRDYTTFTIIDPTDVKVVATCRCNDSNTMQVAKHVYILLKRFPNMLWVPERNNTGIGIIDFVIERLVENNINPFTRIYNEVVQNLNDSKYKGTSIHDYHSLDGRTRAAFGFRTTGGATGGSRNLLYKITMMKLLEMSHSKIFDNTLITEFCNLTEKNGRIDHPEGCHDDTVISLLLGAYTVFFGRHLRLYNIPEGTVLQGITTTGTKVNEDIRQSQLALQKRIQDLEERIDTTNNHILREQYSRELRELKPQLDESVLEVEPIAVSQREYQERVLTGKSTGATVESLRQFSERWRRM